MIDKLVCKRPIEVGTDELVKCPHHIAVVIPAASGPVLRQELYDIGEQDGVGAVGETDQIEETLLGRTVHVGKIFERRRHRRLF